MSYKFNPFTGTFDLVFTSYVPLTGGQIDGNLIIDNTDVEAFLVRKNADGGDILVVDTSTPLFTVNAGTLIETDVAGGLIVKKDTGDIQQFTVDCANQKISSLVEHHFYNHLYAEDDPMYLYDTNDNELVAFDTVASAVNYLSMADSATGNGPELNAAGSDTDIDVEVNPKGTGGLAVGGSGLSIFQEAIVINEGGYGQDSRCEGDTDPNVWYVKSGSNFLGIGTSSPTEKLTVSGNIIVHGENKGTRSILQFNRTSITADAFLGTAAAVFSGSVGYCMPRPGCIVDISASTSVTALSVAGSIVIEARINGVTSFSGLVVVPSSGTYNWYATTTRNAVPFSAGSPIVAYIDYIGFSGTCAPVVGTIGIQQDT